jgi:hypothetical protein
MIPVRTGRFEFKRSAILLGPSFFKTIWAMPASATTAISPGNKIKFSEDAVFAFVVIV